MITVSPVEEKERKSEQTPTPMKTENMTSEESRGFTWKLDFGVERDTQTLQKPR